MREEDCESVFLLFRSVHPSVHTPRHLCEWASKCAIVHMNTYLYANAYIHTYIHTYICMYIHTYLSHNHPLDTLSIPQAKPRCFETSRCNTGSSKRRRQTDVMCLKGSMERTRRALPRTQHLLHPTARRRIIPYRKAVRPCPQPRQR